MKQKIKAKGHYTYEYISKVKGQGRQYRHTADNIGGGGIFGCGVVGGSKFIGTGHRGIPDAPGRGISPIPLATGDDSRDSLLLAEVLPFERPRAVPFGMLNA